MPDSWIRPCVVLGACPPLPQKLTPCAWGSPRPTAAQLAQSVDAVATQPLTEPNLDYM